MKLLFSYHLSKIKQLVILVFQNLKLVIDATKYVDH